MHIRNNIIGIFSGRLAIKFLQGGIFSLHSVIKLLSHVLHFQKSKSIHNIEHTLMKGRKKCAIAAQMCFTGISELKFHLVEIATAASKKIQTKTSTGEIWNFKKFKSTFRAELFMLINFLCYMNT